jgi:hypothetical protein
MEFTGQNVLIIPFDSQKINTTHAVTKNQITPNDIITEFYRTICPGDFQYSATYVNLGSLCHKLFTTGMTEAPINFDDAFAV